MGFDLDLGFKFSPNFQDKKMALYTLHQLIHVYDNTHDSMQYVIQ